MNHLDSYDDGDDTNEYEVEVHNSDMDAKLQNEAANIITEALTIHPKEAQVAKMIKTYFDEKHGRAWQCIVGKHFASYVTHEVKSYILVHVGSVNVMLYKTKG